jgi:hypothetical protein
MHQSFDLYPGYLRHFPEGFDPGKPFRMRYDLHAQRNYKKWRDENGRQIVEPQVRKEGYLELKRSSEVTEGKRTTLSVNHVREWSTWTDSPLAARQTLKADITYRADGAGSLQNWTLTYHSEPILPTSFYRFHELPPVSKSGKAGGREVRISGAEGGPPYRYELKHAPSSLYTLVDTLQGGHVATGKVDYLDDLTMFRPGLELCALPDSHNEIEGHKHFLTGYALVGPAILPQYFWLDEQSRVLAIIGRNVAYTLTEAENIQPA